MVKRKKLGSTKNATQKLVRDQMNRAIKTSIHKTITAVRTAQKYKEIMEKNRVNLDEPSGITVVFTGNSMKVGGSGKVFDEFVETGKINWPEKFQVIRFDETFTYGSKEPENDDSYDPNEDRPKKSGRKFCFKHLKTSDGKLLENPIFQHNGDGNWINLNCGKRAATRKRKHKGRK